MSRTNSLWPTDLAPSSVITPETILRKQGVHLAEQTQGVLRAEIERGSQAEWLTLDFYIIATRLDDYAYRLFKVRHKLPNPFDPLEIILTAKDHRRVRSAAEYEDELGKILGSSETKSLLTEMLSLSAEQEA
jgi:hypothetical protein